MIRRSLGTVLMVVTALVASTGCPSKPSTDTTADSGTSATDPDPHWVIQQTPRAKVALVYVHGVTGDMVGTWTASNGKTFFDLVNENEATKGKADAFVYGFPSYLFKSGSFDIREAANRLHLQLKTQGVLDYPAIVFVAHSMGGLVVMRELLTNRDLLPKVPVVVFYATPMEGALIAAIGQEFSPNSALAQMTEADGNALLQQLSDDWRSIPDADRPHVRCAYEKTTVGPLKIVPWSSATRFCEGAPPAIEANHITIVKPDRPGADAILVLVSALNDYVLGKQLEARLETPDFTVEGDHDVFVLHDALGKQNARLVNSGGGPLTFTLADISDPTQLFLWPDDTPEDIKAHDKVALGVALSRAATAREYRFTIRTPNEDTKVVVRVPDLAAMKAQQSATANAVAKEMQASLGDPQQRERWLAASPDTPSDALVQIAHAAVSKQAPDLPDQARWVLTADLLAATNWPTLAARALRNAEAIAPSTARNPAVQHLAGIVAAQSGDREIFKSSATPVASPETLATWKVAQPLAGQMQSIPALKGFGLSLEGDLQQSKGNATAAETAYTEAAKIRASPSLSSRLQKVKLKSTVMTQQPETVTPATGRRATAAAAAAATTRGGR
jgi:pimeloyl-ACP methyl ester carboxylesterase